MNIIKALYNVMAEYSTSFLLRVEGYKCYCNILIFYRHFSARKELLS